MPALSPPCGWTGRFVRKRSDGGHAPRPPEGPQGPDGGLLRRHSRAQLHALSPLPGRSPLRSRDAALVRQNQKLTRHAVLLILLLAGWIFSVYFSSVHLAADPAVFFQLFALTFVICIGIGSCFVSSYWDERAYQTFFSVYIVASCVAALLGIVGFSFGIPDFTWDGRAKGLLDDPNMYGAFLLPGILGSIHMIALGRRRVLFSFAWRC
jgi:hypothetical protein